MKILKLHNTQLSPYNRAQLYSLSIQFNNDNRKHPVTYSVYSDFSTISFDDYHNGESERNRTVKICLDKYTHKIHDGAMFVLDPKVDNTLYLPISELLCKK